MTTRVRLELEPLGKVVEVERGSALRDSLHVYGVEFPCGGRGRCAGCRVKLVGGSLAVTPEQAGILSRAEVADGWRLACRCTAESDATLEIGQWETVILADHSSFAFTPRNGLGVAVDLGTTTIVAQLVDLASGQVLAVRSMVNPQSIHGSDLMTRLHAALHEGKQAALVGEIRRGVGSLVARLLAAARRDRTRLDSVVVAGNTVMHHFFCGIDVTPLAHSPFASERSGAQRLRASELGWALEGDPPVRFLPCLAGFVGSDLLCGVLATRLHESEAVAVLVDLGTNGEIVVGNRERLLCTSTAAGPAFEGGRIRMGMRATTGAISEVSVDDGRLRCHVIGSAAPRGICGSGLVDAVAAGLDLGLVERSGRLPGGHPLELAGPVALTQGDIRELQLAKAAIAAGIRLLRERFGPPACRDVPIYLAGAFGNYVSRASARRIGLIDAPEERIEPAGNTSLLGAKMALFDADPEADEQREIRARVEHVSLATDPDFQRVFIDETAFPQ